MSATSSAKFITAPFLRKKLPVYVVKRIRDFVRPFLSDRPRTAEASAMMQIVAKQAGDDDSDDDSDDDNDGAVAGSSDGSSGAASQHKWIPDDPSTWNWKTKKGNGSCACGCVVGKSWHTFNRAVKKAEKTVVDGSI